MAITDNTTIKKITISGVLMALIIAVSSFGIPVPGGHLYLSDVIICTAALLLGPVESMIIGGIGTFLGDMIFYPAPMFVSLVTHGLQALVISLCAHKLFPKHKLAGAIVGVTLGGIIMVTGYTLGKIYVYSTFEYAMIKLPYEIAQALLGAVAGVLISRNKVIRSYFNNITKQ